MLCPFSKLYHQHPPHFLSSPLSPWSQSLREVNSSSSTRPSIHPPIHPSIHPSIHSSIHPPIHPCTRPTLIECLPYAKPDIAIGNQKMNRTGVFSTGNHSGSGGGKKVTTRTANTYLGLHARRGFKCLCIIHLILPTGLRFLIKLVSSRAGIWTWALWLQSPCFQLDWESKNFNIRSGTDTNTSGQMSVILRCPQMPAKNQPALLEPLLTSRL